MGINIPDIESIVHLHIPNSIEEYYQQVGRGWRKRNPVKICNCLAVWSEKNFSERKRDLLKQKYTVDEIYEAYTSLTGNAEITDVGQVVNKSKDTLLNGIKLGIPLKLIRRSAATWKCVPPVFDQGVLGGLTRYSGAN